MRLAGNTVPVAVSTIFGHKGLPYLTSKLPNLMQKTIGQIFPALSKKELFTTEKNWKNG